RFRMSRTGTEKPKSEYRNPKQTGAEQTSKWMKNPKQRPETPVWNIFQIWIILISFEFRILRHGSGQVSSLVFLKAVASQFYTEHKKNEEMEPDKSTSLPPKKLRVLVVDDEKNIRTTLSLCLEQLGCAVTATATPEAALTALRQQPYDLAFLDLRLGESNGLDLIPKLLTIDAGLQVIVITPYATI